MSSNVVRSCCSISQTQQLAPKNWYEYYTSVSVESWMWWWIQSMHEQKQWLSQKDEGIIQNSTSVQKRLCDRLPAYQLTLQGKYTIPHGPASRDATNATGGARPDFVWLPVRYALRTSRAVRVLSLRALRAQEHVTGAHRGA